MKEIPDISDTEWQVMKILWEESPLTAGQVIERLAGKVNWKPKTVKTLLGRLVKKLALGFTEDNRLYRYYPLVNEAECVKAESKSFLEKVYNGSLNVMLANFLEAEELSPEEIEELVKILEGKRG